MSSPIIGNQYENICQFDEDNECFRKMLTFSRKFLHKLIYTNITNYKSKSEIDEMFPGISATKCHKSTSTDFFKQKLQRIVYSKIGSKMNISTVKKKINFQINTVKDKLSNQNIKKIDSVVMVTYSKKENEEQSGSSADHAHYPYSATSRCSN